VERNSPSHLKEVAIGRRDFGDRSTSESVCDGSGHKGPEAMVILSLTHVRVDRVSFSFYESEGRYQRTLVVCGAGLIPFLCLRREWRPRLINRLLAPDQDARDGLETLTESKSNLKSNQHS
jgi:hypothetical protein